MKDCAVEVKDKPIKPEELVVIDVKAVFVVDVLVVVAIKPAPPVTVKEDNAVIPVIEPKFNVLLPATVMDATLEKPEVATSVLARFVAEALFVVMFKLLNSAFVSTKVKPAEAEIPDKVKFNPAVVEGTARLFVKVTVAPPTKLTLLTVKFCKALAVIVAAPAVVLPVVAFKLSPLNVTLVIVPAAVVLVPFTSVIVTVPE